MKRKTQRQYDKNNKLIGKRLIGKTVYLGGRKIEIASEYQEWLDLAEKALIEYEQNHIRTSDFVQGKVQQ